MPARKSGIPTGKAAPARAGRKSAARPDASPDSKPKKQAAGSRAGSRATGKPVAQVEQVEQVEQVAQVEQVEQAAAVLAHNVPVVSDGLDSEVTQVVQAGPVDGLSDGTLEHTNALNFEDPDPAGQIRRLLETGEPARVREAIRLAGTRSDALPADAFAERAPWDLMVCRGHYLLGDLQRAGELADALGGRCPRLAACWSLLGRIRADQDQPEEASGHFARACQLEPGNVAHVLELAGFLVRRQRFSEAWAALGVIDRSVRVTRLEHSSLALLRAATQKGLGNRPMAIRLLRLALQRQHDEPELWNQLYALYHEEHQHLEAASALVALMNLRPDRRDTCMAKLAHLFADAHLHAPAHLIAERLGGERSDNRDVLHTFTTSRTHQKGIDDRALASARAAAERFPFPSVLRNRSWAHFLSGDLEAGLRDYEARLDMIHIPEPVRQKNQDWDGSPLNGRTLLVFREQGMGDQIQFARYLQGLRNYCDQTGGGRILLLAEPPLQRLFGSLPVDQVLSDPKEVPAFDLSCPICSLPHRLPAPAAALGNTVPYLRAPGERFPMWGENPRPGTLRIGIAWTGAPANPLNRNRTVPAELLYGMVAKKPVVVCDLQIIHGREPVLTGKLPGLVPRVQEPRDFLDTARALGELDLVISSDTGLVHLCGALGRRDWVLLPTLLDWRWGYRTPGNPWYPQLRLFRQTLLGDWSDVLERVSTELDRYILKFHNDRQISLAR